MLDQTKEEKIQVCENTIRVYQAIINDPKAEENKKNVFGFALTLVEIRKRLLEEGVDVDALIEKYDQLVEENQKAQDTNHVE